VEFAFVFIPSFSSFSQPFRHGRHRHTHFLSFFPFSHLSSPSLTSGARENGLHVTGVHSLCAGRKAFFFGFLHSLSLSFGFFTQILGVLSSSSPSSSYVACWGFRGKGWILGMGHKSGGARKFASQLFFLVFSPSFFMLFCI
jgi:hypothetical protein